MNAPTKITAYFGKKSRPAKRLPSSVHRPQRQLDSGPTGLVVRKQASFTAAEHLRVQREVETRAHQFWLADGGNPGHALDHWLQAEQEVMAEFAAARSQSRPMRPAPLFRLAALF